MTATSLSVDVTQRVLNVAAYKFVQLDDLEELGQDLREQCCHLQLRGTILLSREGINLFVAGPSGNVEEMLDLLRARPELNDLEVKRSFSDKVPFRRMLVRLKREIIPCGVDSVRPEEETSPKLSAHELKRWLDEGRPIRLLDVRNKYEVELGTFHGAEHLELGHFRDFQESLAKLPAQARNEPLVMFCTGGIRCEKAGPLMEQSGFREVYQLDGGILKYFEECGGDHYDGSCFVFDGRVAVDTDLKPTGNMLCFNCQAVLAADDVTSGRFLFGEYCPHCYQEPAQQQLEEMQLRQAKIRALAESQPGSTPYENIRKIFVPGRYAGWKLIDFLVNWQPAIERTQWLTWLAAGQITNHGVANPQQVVREGECFTQHMPDTVEPEINPDITLIYEDESLVAVNKPAPLPCHPSGRFNRNSLSALMAPAYPNEKLRIAHRLDASTTGVVLFCRKYRAARLVQPQFSNREVTKVYLARVHGHPTWVNLQCDLGISEHPTDAGGVREIDQHGLDALSRFQVLKRFEDDTTLVQATPVSGRTNQLRIHLSHLGHGVVGDPIYGRQLEIRPKSVGENPPFTLDVPISHGGEDLGQCPAISLKDPPMLLHAWTLELTHPDTGQRITFTATPPAWANF